MNTNELNDESIYKFVRGKNLTNIKKPTNKVTSSKNHSIMIFDCVNELKSYDPIAALDILDATVPGNTFGKKQTLAYFSKHILRYKHPELDLPKENIVLIGSPGVGKKSLIRATSEVFGLPFINIDLDSLLLENLNMNKNNESQNNSTDDYYQLMYMTLVETLHTFNKYSDYDTQSKETIKKLNPSMSLEMLMDTTYVTPIKNANLAVIYLNNAELLLSYSNNIDFQKDLTKLINSDVEINRINLTNHNLLWILSISEPLSTFEKNYETNVGFKSSKNKEYPKKIDSYNIKPLLKCYGLLNELVKSFDNLVCLKDLTANDFKKIFEGSDPILDTDSSWTANLRLLKSEYNITINLKPDAIEEITTSLQKTGENMYGLKQIISRVLETYYLSPDKYRNKTITLTKEQVLKNLNPL